MKLDAIDKRLLNILQEDSDRTLKELSSILNLTIGPINERIKKLKKAGVIEKNVTILNKEKVGKMLTTYCAVRVEKHKRHELKRFEEKIQNMPEIIECVTISGEYDYLLKIISSSMKEYQDFVVNKLSSLDMIFNVNSQFVIKEVKFSTAIVMD